MTDRELLELAGKAAGIRGEWSERGQCIVISEVGMSWEYWRPLEDDGDALRLAVALRIDVYPWISKEDPASSVMARNSHGFRVTEFASKNRGCRHAATRRAIVRAAAAIGKDMP